MALKLNDRYPGRTNPASIDYPQGSFKNRSSPTAKDGTYLDKDWANDDQGFKQSLLSAAGLTANGQVDKVGSSQYFDALKLIIRNESPTPSQATESVAGIAKIATTQISQGFVNDTDFLTSKKLSDAFKGANFSLGSFAFQKLPSGMIIQSGTTSVTTSANQMTVVFPVAFPTACIGVFTQALITPDNNDSLASAQGYARVSSKTAGNFTMAFSSNRSWFAIGY